MQLSAIIFTALLCFIAFTIGINVGLHGILDLFHEKAIHSDISHNIEITSNSVTQVATFNNSSLTDHIFSSFNNSNESLLIKQTDTIDILDVVNNVTNSYKYIDIVTRITNNSDNLVHNSITSYIASNKRLPILLMTCNRPELLEQTVRSLLSVSGVHNTDVLASQDGTNIEVKSVLTRNSISDIQNTEGIKLRGGVPLDGAQRIARHYKFSISAAFQKFPNAPAIIVVEDDLLFSPDFYQYFVHVAPILEEDKSLFLISAWNDNGFKGKVKEPMALRRTEFFPGLGWLLPRYLYESELCKKWPNEHWDHWLRSYETHQGREIAYPQVPRTYHNGIKGTFMNLETHNKYFRDIDYNMNHEVEWPDASSMTRYVPSYVHLNEEVYETRIKLLIESCHHISTLQELASAQGKMRR